MLDQRQIIIGSSEKIEMWIKIIPDIEQETVSGEKIKPRLQGKGSKNKTTNHAREEEQRFHPGFVTNRGKRSIKREQISRQKRRISQAD